MADRALTVDTGVRPTPSIADNVFRINVVVKVAPARSQDTEYVAPLASNHASLGVPVLAHAPTAFL
jgi:hypothetical protein